MAPKGGPGSAIFFHGTLVHGSPPNMSPWDRQIIYVTYNAVSNAIRRYKRPAYIAHRDFTPIDAWQDDAVAQRRAPQGRRGIRETIGGKMNLHRMLLERAAENKPLRIGLIGAGKFGAMYLSADPDHAGHPSARHRRPLARRARRRTWRGSAGSPRSRPPARSPRRRSTATPS